MYFIFALLSEGKERSFVQLYNYFVTYAIYMNSVYEQNATGENTQNKNRKIYQD